MTKIHGVSLRILNTRDALLAILEESLEQCRARERRAFDSMVGQNTELVLFGAGGLGRKVLSALRAEGRAPLAFADNKLAGQMVEGVPVCSPPEAARLYGNSACFVVTIWASWADTMRDQVESLRDLGCKSIVPFIPLLWKYPHLLPHVQVDLPSRVLEQGEEVLRCFDLWSDHASQREYVSQIRWRMFADFDALNPPLPDQYWQRDLIKLDAGSVFVDAGAFDGDTLEQFVRFTNGRFRAAYLFEPDRGNLSNLEKRLQTMPQELRARIHVCTAAVGDRSEEISFQQGSGISSSAGTGSELVRCIALDDALTETPNYIKYDIEGFELLGLRGTSRIISQTRPSLAVCAYHLQDHLWKIPLLIRSMNQDYRYFLRPHGQIWETVCYAVAA